MEIVMVEKMGNEDWEWLFKRQKQYDKLACEFSGDRMSEAAINEHKRIVKLVDAMPYSEGGRANG